MIRFNSYRTVAAEIMDLCENWPSIFWHKAFPGFAVNELHLRNGTRFATINGTIAKADLAMLAEVWKGRCYTPRSLEIFPNATVVDIGANKGFFSILAAQAAVEGKVFSFEPLPELASALYKNIQLNGLQNVKVFQCAVSNHDQPTMFYVSRSHDGCHSLYRRAETDSVIQVYSTTLDKVCRDENIAGIDFLKLDCEGAEYDILFNLNPDVLCSIRRIAMECHDNITKFSHRDMLEFLKTHEFSVEHKWPYIYALGPARCGRF
ncbi:MAG TPA: FkbM family methyltransferase [Bryobacteraceae bacterium]|nr:FkbM family methyltransferase [Bryobacteraceae bacterium]